MFHVNITLLQDADAIAGYILCRIHVNLDNNRAINLPFDAGCRVLAAYSAGLIEHVRRHSTQISADEYLQSRRFVIADQSDDGKAISTTVLYRPPRALRLVASSVLLFRLADNLQLSLTIDGNVGWRKKDCKQYQIRMLSLFGECKVRK